MMALLRRGFGEGENPVRIEEAKVEPFDEAGFGLARKEQLLGHPDLFCTCGHLRGQKTILALLPARFNQFRRMSRWSKLTEHFSLRHRFVGYLVLLPSRAVEVPPFGWHWLEAL